MRPKDEGRLRFVALPEHRWAHCHFPRAGSWSARTLAADLLGCDYRQPNDQTAEQLAALKADGWLISWFVRQPVWRFMSVYRLFSNPGRARSKEMRVANSDGRLFESIETFAERAFNDFPNDKHIAPQTGWGAEIAHIQAPLWRADEAWVLIRSRVSKLLPDTFPRLNANVDSGESLSAPQSVLKFYAVDLVYWNKVCSDFDPDNLSARGQNVDGGVRRQEEMVRPDAAQRMFDPALVALQG